MYKKQSSEKLEKMRILCRMTSDKCTSATSNRFTVLEIETNTNDGEPINTPFFYMPNYLGGICKSKAGDLVVIIRESLSLLKLSIV